MAIYVFCCNSHIRFHSNLLTSIRLYLSIANCILFTQHAYILWRDIASELWTPVLLFTSIHPPQSSFVYFLQLLFFRFTANISFHSIHLILCFQQTNEIENLTASWGEVFWLFCVQVP